jgi:hypothetical protein
VTEWTDEGGASGDTVEGDTTPDDEAVEALGDGAPDRSPVDLARSLLERVRHGEPTSPLERGLADLDADALEAVRTDRATALAFWLNVYNAAAQLLIDRRPGLFDSRWRFFRTPAVTVAGVDLSLDDVEHGVLRGGRSKYGLGYLPRLARTGLGAPFRLEADPRIHFALNCGAASCPAVLSYDPATVDRTLDDATRAYLDETVAYDPERGRVTVPRLCLWFVGDFGGRRGLSEFLEAYDQIPPGASPSLRFHEYDWTLVPRKFER